MRVGEFHGVVAVDLGEDCLSIVDRKGLESAISLRPVFNEKTLVFEPIKITGAFGSFDDVCEIEVLNGFDLHNITEVKIFVDYADEEFHTRQLQLKAATGHTLTWELFCENTAEH